MVREGEGAACAAIEGTARSASVLVPEGTDDLRAGPPVYTCPRPARSRSTRTVNVPTEAVGLDVGVAVRNNGVRRLERRETVA